MQLISSLRFILAHPLNQGRPLSTVGRFLKWQVASRCHEHVEFNWVAGAKLIARHGMTGATGNIYCGLHEPVEMAFLLHLLRPRDLFLDIGANVGSYTVLASKVCGAQTIAFEPDTGTATSLKENIRVNGLGDLVRVEEVALGAENGVIEFTKGLDTMNRVAAPGDAHVQTVPLRRLDDVAGTADPIFIKMDVEGFEARVLQGASRVLASPSLLAVQSELRNTAVEKILGQFGFSPVFYHPFKREMSATTFEFQSPNTLFVRDCEAVSRRVLGAPLRRILGRDV